MDPIFFPLATHATFLSKQIGIFLHMTKAAFCQLKNWNGTLPTDITKYVAIELL